jgi:hypothetical protein
MSSPTIETNIMEPTLISQAGHCHALVSALTCAYPKGKEHCRVWTHRDLAAHSLSPSEVRRVFSRRARHIQVANRVARSLRHQQVVLSTATTTDLLGIHLLKPIGIRRPGSLVLYMHWYGPKPRKDRFMRRFFKRHPGVVVLAPSRSTVDHLSSLGAKRIAVVEYPFAGLRERAAASATRTPTSPPAIIVAGAARMDKGLPISVDLIECLSRDNRTIDVRIQASPTHWGDVKPDVAIELSRLQGIGYQYLVQEDRTLTDQHFREFIRDGIAMLPYDATAFSDRVSAVAIDALVEGSPIVTTKGTWMAGLVERFDAGIVVEGSDGLAWRNAVDTICSDWHAYRNKALDAATALAPIHHPRHFWDAIERLSQ